jgi:hypothetical protein
MTKKKPLKTEYCTLADIFPWLKMEKLTQKEYEKRQAKRKRAERAHPKLKVKAYGDDWYFESKKKSLSGGVIIRDAQLFIDVSEADPKQKKALNKWLNGQTCPKIPGVEAACYVHDYARFHEAFIDGRVAEVND